MLRDLTALLLQAVDNLLPGNPIRSKPHRNRILVLEGITYLFYLFEGKLLQPSAENPLGHRVTDRQILQRILLRQGVDNVLHSPGCSAQNAVHKPFQIVEASLLGKPHRLIDYRAVRNTVHIFQLIDAHPQKIADQRLHIMDRHLGEALNDIVDLNQILQRSLRYTGDKSAVTLQKILVLFQCVAQNNMAVCLSLRDLHQDAKNDLSQIHSSRHSIIPTVSVSVLRKSLSVRSPADRVRSFPGRPRPLALPQTASIRSPAGRINPAGLSGGALPAADDTPADRRLSPSAFSLPAVPPAHKAGRRRSG